MPAPSGADRVSAQWPLRVNAELSGRSPADAPDARHECDEDTRNRPERRRGDQRRREAHGGPISGWSQ